MPIAGSPDSRHVRPIVNSYLRLLDTRSLDDAIRRLCQLVYSAQLASSSNISQYSLVYNDIRTSLWCIRRRLGNVLQREAPLKVIRDTTPHIYLVYMSYHYRDSLSRLFVE